MIRIRLKALVDLLDTKKSGSRLSLEMTIRNLLGVGASEAEKISRKAEATARHLSGNFMKISPGVTDDVRLVDKQEGACVLAIPMTTTALGLACQFVSRSERRTFILDTPLTRRLLVPHLRSECVGRVRFLSLAELVRTSRLAANDRERNRWAFITFPDHQICSDEAALRISVFGTEHVIPPVEPVLIRHGMTLLATLDSRDVSGSRSELRLVLYPLAEFGSDPRKVLEWLMLRVERACRAAPEQVLSWPLLEARSVALLAQRRAMNAKLLDSFLRSWAESDSCLPDGSFRAPLERLAVLLAGSADNLAALG